MLCPREFDEDQVLDAAIDCFPRRGLAATSVRDLAADTGRSGPSLYNAFGGKRELFACALERYTSPFIRERIARLEQRHAPKAAIKAFFREIVNRSHRTRLGVAA